MTAGPTNRRELDLTEHHAYATESYVYDGLGVNTASGEQMTKLIPLLTLALLGSAVAQTAKHERSADEPTTTVCELLANASRYNGKSVTVKATYASGEEYAILKDDSCQPAPDKTKLVLATFSSKYQFKSALDKKLHKIVKKDQQAEVTVIGIFTDPGHNIGHQGCCRYKFEVQQLLNVEEARPQAAQALPVVIHADVPTYPTIAKAARISGRVQVQVTVKDGAVTETKLLGIPARRANEVAIFDTGVYNACYATR